MCEDIIQVSNYVKKWSLTEPTPHTYQGLIDLNTNQYNGMGRIKYLSASNQIQTYIGTFLQGKITGSGTIWYLDGSIYKGQILDSIRHGYGTMYGPNGKFQYDGVWANDLIDKPIYKAITNSSGQIEYQGFQVNGEFQGWVINHSDGQISQIKFYQNNIAIKGFIKHKQNYIINSSEISNISNEQAYKFLFEELPKLNKQEQLQQFLSDEANIKMLEEFSFDYDLDTGERKKTKSFKKFNDKGLSSAHFGDLDIIVEINASTNTVFIQKSNELSRILGSLWSVNANKINSIKLVLLDENNFGLEGFNCLAMGEFICSKSNSTYELNGQGLLKAGSKEYNGMFIANKIIDGTEKSNGIKIYEGKFNSSGKYHGIGTQWNLSGKIIYQGEFSNGQFHGNGSSYYINSDTEAIEYVGQWVNNCKHGQGTLFSISGDEIFTGLFNNNQIA